MLEDYKKAVIADYHQKKVKGLLSLNLSHSTPANLREECRLVLNSRPQEKDEKIIRDFFNSGVISSDYRSSIERFDPDRLRPLDNFIKGRTISTEPTNIELLAWLINFEPRPYQYGVTYGPTVEIPAEEIKDNKEEPKQKQAPKEETESPTKSSKRTSNRVPISKYGIDVVVFLIVFVSGIGLSMRNASIERTTTAYICTSKVSKKYHLNAKCHGLNNCKKEIVSTTIAKAKDGGKTLCENER